MSEMVDLVASVMLLQVGIDPEIAQRVAAGEFVSVYPESMWDDLRGVARVVIEAMREPTKAMVLAGDEAGISDGAHDCEVPMADIYRAMLDEALK